MPNLKVLKRRIDSVKSTQKITSAMKMVAAAKLRRAQESVEAARPYALRMERILGSLAASISGVEGAPRLLAGTGAAKIHLIVAFTGDRGLCGGFNGSIVRATRIKAHALKAEGKTVKIFCVGRKGNDVLKREFADEIIESVQGLGRRNIKYKEAAGVAEKINAMLTDNVFDVCTIIFNRFQSAMTQVVTQQQMIPFVPSAVDKLAVEEASDPRPVYIFEPEEEDILTDLLPRNLAVQIFQALLENSASEHGARMTAMDSATRNAGDMIDSLTLTYNRTRQAVITKELIEIISGAEAL
jgi:F-type H+-transporting ATPase subunit gamma